MKENDFIFWQVIRSEDRGHRHYTFAIKTFGDEQKALRWAVRHCTPDNYAVVKICTYKSGAIQCDVVFQGTKQ